MPPDADVLVIGAGPAGLATAIAFARLGTRVRVLDRAGLPADKVCGEGLMPPGLQFLDEIGATPHLGPASGFPFLGIRYVSPGGRTAAAEFEAGPGRGIRRLSLSTALRRTAAGLPSLDLQLGVRVTGLQRRERLMVVSTADHGAITARLVVGADGLRSRVRQWAGLQGAPARRQRFGVRRHFRIAPWSHHVEVHNGRHLEAYVTPCGADLVNVAILWEPKRCPFAARGARLFPSLLETLPSLHDRLSAAEPVGPARSTGPFHQRTTRRTADGVALVGDASGYLDPCTGEGLTLAFKQARALAASAAPVLADSLPALLSAHALRPYERAWRDITRPYFLATRFLLFALDRPALFDRIVAFLARRPDVLRHFLSFNMGAAPLLPGLKRTAGWILPHGPTHAEHS